MNTIGRIRFKSTVRKPAARRGVASDAPVDKVDIDPAKAAADIRTLLKGRTDRFEERQILDILRNCGGTVIDQVLRQLDLSKLIGSFDDHFTMKNRTELLDMLTAQRLSDLSIETRSKVVDGLQYHNTDALDERSIRNVFLGTRGAELTELKNRIDAGGDYRDLQQLIFSDIDDEGIRAEILSHIKQEAVPTGTNKAVSDIDDTFYRNWKDPRYPAKCVYPGVRQLYKELGALTFISARPGEPSGSAENRTHRSLREKGIEEAVVLTGSLGNLHSDEAIAAKKHENFVQYRQLFPEYGAVLLGDSGQGDAIFGARAIESDGDAVRAVFIHDVVATPQAERDRMRERGIIFCDTYVDTAVEAHLKGLITRDAVQRVADAAVREMAAIQFDTPAQRAAREAELARALERVDQLSLRT